MKVDSKPGLVKLHMHVAGGHNHCSLHTNHHNFVLVVVDVVRFGICLEALKRVLT